MSWLYPLSHRRRGVVGVAELRCNAIFVAGGVTGVTFLSGNNEATYRL